MATATVIEDDDEERSIVVSGSAVSAEIDKQIATAKAYPRSFSVFKKTAMEMATLDEETAESCFYVLPRSGRDISGPGVRLAEIVASAWHNMRVEAKQVGEVQPADKFVTVSGTAWDMETNVAWSIETKRRIVDKNGKQYNDDMVGVTTNAACAIAGRNAVFKVVPSAYWKTIYEKCLEIVKGDVETLASRRASALEHFQKLGVSQDKVFGVLEVKDVEDITLDHLVKLRGLATALKEGSTTLDEAFPKPDSPTMPAKKSEKKDEKNGDKATTSGQENKSSGGPVDAADSGGDGAKVGDKEQGSSGQVAGKATSGNKTSGKSEKDSKGETKEVQEKADPLKVKLDALRKLVEGPIEAIRDIDSKTLQEMCKGLKGDDFNQLLIDYSVRKADLK